MILFKILFNFIYLDRYRKLTYGDSSKFYVFIFFYVVTLYQCVYSNFEFIKYFLLWLVFFQSSIIMNRNDYLLLKTNLGGYKTYFIIVLDLILINLLVLIILPTKNVLFLFISIFCIVVYPLILNFRKINNKTPLPFSTHDPIWIIYIRQKPWMIIILIIGYYIQFQALKNGNKNLFIISCYAVPFYVMNMFQEMREKFIFFKFIKNSPTNHINSMIRAGFLNTIYFLIPTAIIIFYNGAYFFEVILLMIPVCVFFVPLKYIFAHNVILHNIFSIFSQFICFLF